MGANCLSEYKIYDLNKVVWFQEGPGVRKNQFRTSGVKLLNVGNICDRELILDKTSIYISEEEAYGKYKHFLVDEGDLLIASSGIKVEYFDKKITFARKEHLPLCMNTSTIRFKVLDKDVLDINYFRHFLASRYFTKQVQFYITGSAQLNFGPSHLNKMKIIVPPIEDQRRIAQVLDKADEIRQKKKLANDKLDEFLKSTFIDMFGDPIKNEKGWSRHKMEKLMTIKRGGSPRPIEKFLGGEYHWIKIGDATKNSSIYIYDTKEKIIEEGLNKTTFLPKGSLIFANCGVSLGFARILKIDGCIHDGWLSFSDIDETLNKIFLLKTLNHITEYFRKIAPDGTQPNLNTSIMKNFEVIVPPIDEQNKFAQIVEKVEAQKQKNEQVIEQMDNLFNSLSQRAFKGEL